MISSITFLTAAVDYYKEHISTKRSKVGITIWESGPNTVTGKLIPSEGRSGGFDKSRPRLYFCCK